MIESINRTDQPEGQGWHACCLFGMPKMVIPEGTRTPYLQIKDLSLYPDELRDHAPYMRISRLNASRVWARHDETQQGRQSSSLTRWRRTNF